MSVGGQPFIQSAVVLACVGRIMKSCLKIDNIMMIDVAEVIELNQISSDIIRERAYQSKVKKSRQFIACIGGSEAGYLSFDDRSDIGVGVLYDLLVLPAFRCKGIGGELVKTGEQLSFLLRHIKIRVLPRAFDGSINQEWLGSWYEKRGYVMANDGTQEYEKNLP